MIKLMPYSGISSSDLLYQAIDTILKITLLRQCQLLTNVMKMKKYFPDENNPFVHYTLQYFIYISHSSHKITN